MKGIKMSKSLPYSGLPQRFRFQVVNDVTIGCRSTSTLSKMSAQCILNPSQYNVQSSVQAYYYFRHVDKLYTQTYNILRCSPAAYKIDKTTSPTNFCYVKYFNYFIILSLLQNVTSFKTRHHSKALHRDLTNELNQQSILKTTIKMLTLLQLIDCRRARKSGCACMLMPVPSHMIAYVVAKSKR